MATEEGSAFVVGIMVGMILTAFVFGIVPKDANDYHSFTKAVCVEDCKYLEDVEIQCNGNTLKQLHPLGFYVPNSKGLNITIDEKTICVRD
jgi:hypothetical protein